MCGYMFGYTWTTEWLHVEHELLSKWLCVWLVMVTGS